MASEIHHLMDRWARYRVDQVGLGYGKSFLAKCLDGLPSLKCIVCNGLGRVPGAKEGSRQAFVVCENCNGSGKVKARSTVGKINPAFIRGGHHAGVVYDDPVSDKIEEVFQHQLNWTQRQVVELEYCHPHDTQHRKARRVRRQRERDGRKGISSKYFSEALNQALEIIEAAIADMVN